MPILHSSILKACRRIQYLAEVAPRQAVAQARRVFLRIHTSGDKVEQAWAAYTLGWALLSYERFDAARIYLRHAQDCFEQAHITLGQLHCRFAFLIIEVTECPQPTLLTEFEDLYQSYAETSVSREAAKVQLYQAVLLNVLGRFGEAIALLDLIKAKALQLGGVVWPRWLRIRAAAACGQSDYILCTELLLEARGIFSRLRLRIDIVKCWYEQGWAALRQEQVAAAFIYYCKAEYMFARLDLPFRRARCQKEQGYLLTLGGHYALALGQTLAALRYFESIAATRELAGCHLHLGNIYLLTSRWESALACYTRAEALFASVDLTNAQRIVRRNRAMVLRAQGRIADAYMLAQTIVHEALATHDRAEVAEAQCLLARLLADASQSDAALQLYQETQQLFIITGNLPAAMLCDVEAAWLLLERGHYQLAHARFCSAATILEEQPHHHWRIDYGLARCAEVQGDQASALIYYRQAGATVARLRERLLSEELSSGVYQQAAQMHIDALACAARVGDPLAFLILCEEQRALVFKYQRSKPFLPFSEDEHNNHVALRNTITAALQTNSPLPHDLAVDLDNRLMTYSDVLIEAQHTEIGNISWPEHRIIPTFDLAHLRAALALHYGEAWTIVVYTLVSEHLWAVVVTPTDVAMDGLLFDAEHQQLLQYATEASYQAYTYRDLPFRRSNSGKPWETLTRLGDWLFPLALRQRLDPHHHLIIVPTGMLHALPWAALRIHERWLIQDTLLQVVPSLAGLPGLLACHAQLDADALLIGCSAFGMRATSLPGVANELAAVSANLPGQYTQLLDAEATCTALRTLSRRGQLPQYGWLHIATHAQLYPTRGQAAHIKLWDGDLWLHDIVALRLGGGVVIVSSCDGAAADSLPGEEVLSLGWAFLAAGAGGVMASLWPLYDQAAASFMQQFYTSLRKASDLPTALALTQRALIEQADAAATFGSEPQVWASFVALGAGVFVRTTGGTNPVVVG